MTDSLSQNEICSAFKDDQIYPPDLTTPDWQNLDYLGWINPSGHLAYLVVVSPDTGRLTSSTLHRAPRGSLIPRYEMCSWCPHLHGNDGTAMFTLDVKGSSGRHLIGEVLCKNLDCSLRIRDLVDPPSYMVESSYPNARIWRMQKSMYRWLKRRIVCNLVPVFQSEFT